MESPAEEEGIQISAVPRPSLFASAPLSDGDVSRGAKRPSQPSKPCKMAVQWAVALLCLCWAAAASGKAAALPGGWSLSEWERKVPAKSPYAEDFDSLDVWEWAGLDKAPQRLFSTAALVVRLEGAGEAGEEAAEEVRLYQSGNRTEVLEAAASERRFFGFFRRVAQWRSYQLAPFRRTYVGLEINKAYSVRVALTRLNYAYLGLFVAGCLGFVSARRLTRNALFYYGSGTGLGLVASLLILVFVLYRLLPRRSLAYSVLIGGWSFSFYVLYSLWQNLATVLLQYQKWLAVYLVSVFAVSFGVCYRLGPPKDPRSLNLLQWGLQLASLCLVVAACQITEMGLALAGALLLFHNLPQSLVRRLESLCRRIFPPKTKLLSEAEFERQGREATAKALRDLRDYCRSPECNTWKTMSRLRTPQRMAEFVEGASHLNDSELLSWDVESSLSDVSSLSGEESESDASTAASSLGRSSIGRSRESFGERRVRKLNPNASLPSNCLAKGRSNGSAARHSRSSRFNATAQPRLRRKYGDEDLVSDDED